MITWLQQKYPNILQFQVVYFGWSIWLVSEILSSEPLHLLHLLEDISPFEGPLIHLIFGLLVMCALCFKVKVNPLCTLHKTESSDSPLVRHLLTSWQPAWQLSRFHLCIWSSDQFCHQFPLCLALALFQWVDYSWWDCWKSPPLLNQPVCTASWLFMMRLLPISTPVNLPVCMVRWLCTMRLLAISTLWIYLFVQWVDCSWWDCWQSLPCKPTCLYIELIVHDEIAGNLHPC